MVDHCNHQSGGLVILCDGCIVAKDLLGGESGTAGSSAHGSDGCAVVLVGNSFGLDGLAIEHDCIYAHGQ